jgi:hypothetical protein
MKRERDMRRNIIGIVLVCFFGAGLLFSARFLSVPLDSRVYQILDNAVAQGAISQVPNIRPYTASDTIGYLKAVEQSDLITEKERSEVQFWINELERQYGSNEIPNQNVWRQGFYRFNDERLQSNVTIGARFTFQETGGTLLENPSFAYDSRNAVTAYLKGDLGTHLSYSMDFTFRVDRLDDSVFLPSEFSIPAEGFYQYLKWVQEGTAQSLPMAGFANSNSMSPEITGSFLDSRLIVRFASIQHDWGPGMGNLLLSETARPFDAVEATFSFTPNLRMGFITGSLGVFTMTYDEDALGVSYPNSQIVEDGGVVSENISFKNNYSAHRVEWDVTPRLTLSLSEGVVYRRRFVLGYLNPFSIYYMVQGAEGDIDKCIASFDIQYTLPGIARMYGSFVATEVSAYKGFDEILSYPRNSIGIQGGMDIPLQVGSFTTLTAQVTYLSPFVYTHYIDRDEAGTVTYTDDTDDTDDTVDVNGVPYSTTYINKGQSLGYSLSLNTIEYLLAVRTGLAKGLTGKATVKVQQRSYQYGKSNLEVFCNYTDAGNDKYASTNFFSFIGNYKLSVELGLEKQFAAFPLTISGSLRFQSEWDRPITNESNDQNKYGYTTELGAWASPVFGLYGTIGVKLYY